MLNVLIENLVTGHNSKLLEPASLEATHDNFAIVDYKSQRIGIITFGDPGCESAVENRISTCKDFDCSIIVGASRTYGKIYDILLDHAKSEGAQMFQTEPLYTYSYTVSPLLSEKEVNQLSADYVLHIIDHLLKQKQK